MKIKKKILLASVFALLAWMVLNDSKVLSQPTDWDDASQPTATSIDPNIPVTDRIAGRVGVTYKELVIPATNPEMELAVGPMTYCEDGAKFVVGEGGFWIEWTPSKPSTLADYPKFQLHAIGFHAPPFTNWSGKLQASSQIVRINGWGFPEQHGPFLITGRDILLGQ